VRQLIRDLALLGVAVLSIPVGRRTESPERRRILEAAAKVLDRLGDYAGEHGIRLAMEVPHCWDMHNNLERVGEMFALLRSPNIGALLDSSHWAVLKYDLEQWYQAVQGRLWHVHLRDARGGDRADMKHELEFTAGRGECDFAKLSAWLDGHHYDGEVSIEFEYRDPGMALDAIEAEYDFGLRALRRMRWALPEEVILS
jgi:sugar phosphate isomerase/epimerase